jgi:hypothetical protein
MRQLTNEPPFRRPMRDLTRPEQRREKDAPAARAGPGSRNADELRDWHPLDGVSAPEYVPECWDGPHVGKRLVEALRVLARIPMNGYPHSFRNSWPNYAIDFEDETGWTLPDPRTGLVPDRPPLK